MGEHTSTLSVLHPTAIAPDVETFPFDRALMAPPIVCTQWARQKPGGKPGEIESCVATTQECATTIEWIFNPRHEQIWFHNGMYDLACMMEWYPDLRQLIWQALTEGRVYDTMWLQRMIQICKGQIGGALALDATAKAWGVPPPSKEIEATHPNWPGQVFDVRLSFGLWYNAPEIPEPWYSYADYDSVATLRIAAHQVAAFCVPKRGHRYPMVRLEDLAWVVRQRYGLYLSRTYGLRNDPKAVSDLARVARVAQLNLQEAAIEEGFLKPAVATGAQKATGQVSGFRFCAVDYETEPEDPDKAAAWRRRRDRHKHPLRPTRRKNESDEKWAARWQKYEEVRHEEKPCRDCAMQALDERGNPHWKLDTKNLEARIIEAYGGDPPLTEPTKQKDGTFSGGGNVSRSRDTLQDSQDPVLEAFAQYNEYTTLQNKDLRIFEHSPVHTNFGMANTFRPTSSNPNILNFRRTGFILATCPNCQYEMTLDPKQHKPGQELLCPSCGQ